MLNNDRYLGLVRWNQTNQGVYKGGTKVTELRPESDHIQVDLPELRIISDELWLRTRRVRGKRHFGRQRAGGPKPKYFLSGMSRCGVCGGPIRVNPNKIGQHKIKAYGCAYHRDRGNAVCTNTLKRPVEAVDTDMIGLMKDVLTEEVIALAFKKLRERIEAHGHRSVSELPALQVRCRDLEQQLKRLGDAIATSTEPPASLVQAMSEREKELTTTRERIAAVEASASVLSLEARRLEKDAQARLAHLHTLLGRNPEEARGLLGKLLVGPLVWTPTDTPQGRRFEIQGQLDPTGVQDGLGGVEDPESKLGGGHGHPPLTGVPNGI